MFKELSRESLLNKRVPVLRSTPIRRFAVGAGIALLIPIASCGDAGGTRAELPSLGPFTELATPTGPGAGEPFLSPGQDGLILSWLQPAGSDDEFRFSILRPGATEWTESLPITRRPDLFVNWADFPSVIELPDGSLAAHWLQYSGPGTYSYGIRVVRSADGGVSWTKPIAPYADTSRTEHGFVVLFPSWPESGSGFSAVWLDGREYANAAADPAYMTLRSATITSDGMARDEVLLDPSTCDCCQTSVAQTSEGPVVAYRGRTVEEIRDIRVVRATRNGWSEPVTVHADGWEIPACPVNGPAIVAAGDTVAVTWFTRADDVPRVLTAFSKDGGRTFASPVRIDAGNPLGRIDSAMLPDGVILSSWLEVGDEDADIRVRAVALDGRMGEPVLAGQASSARAGGFPRMAIRGNRMILAWTVPGEPSAIRLLTTPIRQ
jgi:hypothetical protein